MPDLDARVAALMRYTPDANLYNGMALDAEGQWVLYKDAEKAIRAELHLSKAEVRQLFSTMEPVPDDISWSEHLCNKVVDALLGARNAGT